METPKSLTLRELQLSIKSSITEKFPLPVWVSAEISELKVNYSGHCYLELVEKGERDGASQAQARAVIWRNNYTALSSYFIAQTNQRLAPGLKVLVKVLVGFHELYGMSLQITDIDPSYTLGDIERERQLSIEKLKSDGVWDMNSSIPLPRLIQRIAIISSANAAGYQDFYKEISGNNYHLDLTLFEAYMQGAGAEDSIISALESISSQLCDFDVVVIIRGGGSVNDLRCFDSYRLASHVAQFPLPVLSGIGHDKDISVVDMVSSKSLKTPTAVATFLVENLDGELAWLEGAMLSLHDAATQITRNYFLQLESYQTDILARARQKIESENIRLENFNEILPSFLKQFVTLQRNHLEALNTAVELHSPQHLLQLGYAVVRIGEKALHSSEGLEVGSDIKISLSDAQVVAQVKKIEKNKKYGE